MKSQNAQLQSTKSQLDSIKAEYLGKEESAKKQIEQLNAKMDLMNSSASLEVDKPVSSKPRSSFSGSVIANEQFKTLKEEYDEKLSQKKEIDEYIENQLPAVTAQIKQLNEEHARVSSELERAKSELNP
jgi:archaellum component FlaC